MSNLKPSYLFVGDNFLVEEKFREISRQLEGSAGSGVSFQTYHLSECSIEKILSEARTLPFLAAVQLFRIREADCLKKDDLEKLETYLARPAEGTILFFEAETLDKKEGLSELVKGSGTVEFLSEEQKEAAGAVFIREKLKVFGKTLSPAAQKRLEEGMVQEPALLDSFLDQLASYSGAQNQITEEMVGTFEEKVGRPDGFELVQAIANQNTGRALSVLRELLEASDQDAVSLIGLLHWQLKRFWAARVLLEEGAAEGVLLKRCGVSPRQAPYFMRQVKRFSREKLERAVEGLFQLDWKLKTGRVEGPEALELWLVELMS